MEKLNIRLALQSDLTKVAQIYDLAGDFSSGEENIVGWKKGVYPTIQTAQSAFEKKELYIATLSDEIVGSFIINSQQDPVYYTLTWSIDAPIDKVLVIHTFLVSRHFTGKNIGKDMLTYILKKAEQDYFSTIRLDTYEKNSPAIKLYECLGFCFVGKVNLGIENEFPGYQYFNCYDIVIKSIM